MFRMLMDVDCRWFKDSRTRTITMIYYDILLYIYICIYTICLIGGVWVLFELTCQYLSQFGEAPLVLVSWAPSISVLLPGGNHEKPVKRSKFSEVCQRKGQSLCAFSDLHRFRWRWTWSSWSSLQTSDGSKLGGSMGFNDLTILLVQNLGWLAIHWLRCLLKAQPPTRKRPSQLHVAVVAFGDACVCSQSTLKSPEKMVKDG